MKKSVLFLFVFFSICSTAQNITLRKGIVMDGIRVNDSIPETFSLYLPKTFELAKKWPVLFVYDMKGRGKRALSMFQEAAENQGYVLAASNNIQDTLSLTQNILVSSRMFNAVSTLIPTHKNRIYTGGYSDGARFASLVPTFIKEVQGVLASSASIANVEVLSSDNPFHFIGIVGVEDYNYHPMLANQKVLDKLRFPNNLLVFEGGQEWPSSIYIDQALEIFTLASMAKSVVLKDAAFIDEGYQSRLAEVRTLVASNRPLQANRILSEMTRIYRPHKNIDSIKAEAKSLRRSKSYRGASRAESTIVFKESLIKEDYVYYLEEDVIAYNYNNLGWWKYQMELLQKYDKSTTIFEKQMGRRLAGFINAAIADAIDSIKAQERVDEEALNFLWMLHTITDADAYESYMKVVSYSAKIEDYDTALFYLEELLKNGYKDKKRLYGIEHTALLRIMPEFNTMIAKYLEDPRYEIIEQ